MNALLRLHKDMAITQVIPFKYLLYAALLSSVTTTEIDDTKFGVFTEYEEDIYDLFPDWDDPDDRKSQVVKAISDLEDEGLITIEEDGTILLGEYRGRRLFTFEATSSLTEGAMETYERELKRYGSSKSAKDKSRSRYIREHVQKFIDGGIEKMKPADFTELHGYLYEIYTGGEIYNLRNKTEYFQTNNMLKAFDRPTVFALLVEATLNFDKHRKKGMPTLTTVAYMKDDVFKSLTRADAGSKDYMRDMTSAMDSDSTF